MRSVIVCLLLATSSVAAAPEGAGDPKPTPATEPAADGSAADAKPAKPPRKASPDAVKVTAALERIVKASDAAARRAAIDELNTLAPNAVETIGEWLARPHATSVEERREVLLAIDAAVPDSKGRFPPRKRETAAQRKADDEIDWLKKLLELPAADVARPGLGEVIADIAAIRALSATKDTRAAQLIFDTAFLDETMIYRDECGRYVRKMEPFSIPTLTKESQGRGDRRRYGNWQLERLDRQDPQKALAAATANEALQIEILEVFRKTKLREAVHAVWTKVNDPSPRIRAAARRTWMDYITGPPPRPAPKMKLKLPGGKLTKEEKPLWLTYRELADNELRNASNELLGTDYPVEDETRLDDREVRIKVVKIDLEDVTKQLFAYFDGERAKREAAQWAEAKAKADAGELETAAAMLDRLISINPERAERAEMAKVYVARAKQLEKDKQWAQASAAYSKAHGLDPDGAAAKDTLAAHHYALGKALEAQGKDGGPDFRRAVALKPDYAPAQTAADRTAPNRRPTWMLYGAALAIVVAAALFGLAMLRRKQPA